jgi:hypothetical protein
MLRSSSYSLPAESPVPGASERSRPNMVAIGLQGLRQILEQLDDVWLNYRN